MPTPAATQIIDIVGTRLANISTDNGYNTTPLKIERARLTPWDAYDLPFINYWATGINSNRNSYGSESRTISLLVSYHDKTRDLAFIDVANKLAFDVVTALHRTDSNPASDNVDIDFGGTITDIILASCDYEIGEGQYPWCGVLCRFNVNYVADIGDMSNYGRS